MKKYLIATLLALPAIVLTPSAFGSEPGTEPRRREGGTKVLKCRAASQDDECPVTYITTNPQTGQPIFTTGSLKDGEVIAIGGGSRITVTCDGCIVL